MSKVEIRRRAPDKRKVRAPGRIPASETNLTVKERAMLPDPDWVTEDDADVIMSLRELKASGGKLYSLEEVLRKNGFTLDRSNPGRSRKTTAGTRRRRETGRSAS